MPGASENRSTIVVTSEALLAHWQGHRRLTRRVIETFPEPELFQYSVGGLRPFAALAMEAIGMAVPSLRGLITGTWEFAKDTAPTARADLLQRWDQTTAEIDALWPTIPPHRFLEVDKAFGLWEQPGYQLLLYVIDNEVHHRGQGYVYLRSLGIAPPPFYERD